MSKVKAKFVLHVISSSGDSDLIRARALKLGATSVTTSTSSPGYCRNVAVFSKKNVFSQFKDWVMKQRNLELAAE